MTEPSDWQRVAALTDISAGEPLGAKHGDRDIVLVAEGGSIFALAGICPHAYALMRDGFQNGIEIECPLHAAIFDIRTGKCLDGPAGTGDLATFEVKIEGEDVLVRARHGAP
jgi:3-phenylpropionate/trans-cinnamate dioxygenase ferredoxin component